MAERNVAISPVFEQAQKHPNNSLALVIAGCLVAGAIFISSIMISLSLKDVASALREVAQAQSAPIADIEATEDDNDVANDQPAPPTSAAPSHQVKPTTTRPGIH